MKKLYKLKGIFILFFVLLILTSCGNQSNSNFLVNKEEIGNFLKENDQDFLEIIEFVPTEKNSSDLIIVYTSDAEPEFTKYEVALINLKKPYYENLYYIHDFPHVYNAKSLDDFILISDSSPSPNELPYWYPVLQHWQRSDKKDRFEVTRETYIADVSLEEPEYDVYRLGSKYEEPETGKLIDISGENGVLNLIYRKHNWYVNLLPPETEIRYNKEKERFEVNIKNTSTDITSQGFQGDEYLDSVILSEGYGGDIKLYIYPTDAWDKRFYVESEIVIGVPEEDLSIIQTKIILNVDHDKEK